MTCDGAFYRSALYPVFHRLHTYRDSSRARCSHVGLVLCTQRPPLPGIGRRSTTLDNISERHSACANLDAVKLLQAAGRRVADRLGRDSRSATWLRPLYERALYWSTLGRGIAWPINGVEYRIDPRHRHRLGQDYDPPVARFLAGRIRPGATCVDVGANVGAYVLQLAHWSRPEGRVMAISEFPKWRKYLISLSFRGQSSVRPVQVGGFDVNIVIHRSTAVRGRGGPARHDAWPPSLGAILPTRTGPVEADGAVDAQNAPTAPWKTRSGFHELPQGFSHQITHEKHRKAPK